MLITLRKIYIYLFQLRRDLANKQAELDTLLHEKQTIWEQQAGAAAHHDRELIGKYSNILKYIFMSKVIIIIKLYIIKQRYIFIFRNLI